MADMYGTYHGARWLVDPNPESGIIAVNHYLTSKKKTYRKVETYLEDELGFKKIETRNQKGTITPAMVREKELAYRPGRDTGSWKSLRPGFRKPIESLESIRDGLVALFEKTKYNATCDVFEDDDGNIAYLIKNNMDEKSLIGQTLLAGTATADLLAFTYNDLLDEKIVDSTHDILTHVNMFTASEGTDTRWLHEYASVVPWLLYAQLALFSLGVYFCAYKNSIGPKRSQDPLRPTMMTRDDIEFPISIPKDMTVIIKNPNQDEAVYNKIRDDLVNIMKLF